MACERPDGSTGGESEMQVRLAGFIQTETIVANGGAFGLGYHLMAHYHGLGRKSCQC